MRKFLILIFLFCQVNISQAQKIVPVNAIFKWQLFEDVIEYKVGDKSKFKLYKSDLSTKSDGYLEGVFETYYSKGWIDKQNNQYIFNAPKELIWLVDTTKVGTDIVYLTDEDDMINIGVWPIVYDRKTLELIAPDIVNYVQVKFPSKEKVNAQAIKRYLGDDPLRNSCSKAGYLSKEKEKEKKDKKIKEKAKNR